MNTSLESPRWAAYAAAAVPFVVYAFTAGGHGYWLDSAEFTAAAVALDIPHPPGHPLANLWGKLFALLPVGPLPYRVAMGQAAAAALALAFVQPAIARTLERVGDLPRNVRVLLSLSASWALGGAYGFWFQGVRAEVYALQALLVCIALERASLLASEPRPTDPRPLYVACLALGFGLANHHFIAVLALPALLVELARLLRVRGPRVLFAGALAGSLGLATYIYLPLVALRAPAMDLGHPVTWESFWWVVSAQVYARNIGSEALQPLGERFADLLVIIVENFTGLTLLLALLGGYALVRRRESRPLAYLWLSTVLVSLCGRAWLNPVRANPDVLGYMMPGFAALVALASAGIGALLTLLPPTPAGRRALLALCAALLALALAQFPREAARASLRTFEASTHLDDLRRRSLPPRSLVVLTTPESVFRHWEGEAVEGLRRDITLLPVPFLGYGGMHEVLLEKEPTLRPLVDHYLAHGALSPAALRELSRRRPVFVELDTRVSLASYAISVPDSLLYRIEPELDAARIRHGARSHTEAHAQLRERIDAGAREPETRKQLVWQHYIAALYFAHHGERALARGATERGLALSPHTRELRLLHEALAAPASGPLELTPFMPPRQQSR